MEHKFFKPWLKPVLQKDGYYHFNCENCNEESKSKSPKSRTCGQRCRNMKNKKEDAKKRATELLYTRKYIHNASVLRQLAEEGIFEPLEQTLELLKFNNDIDTNFEIIENIEVKFFGEYGIGRKSTKNYKIFKKHGI